MEGLTQNIPFIYLFTYKEFFKGIKYFGNQGNKK